MEGYACRPMQITCPVSKSIHKFPANYWSKSSQVKHKMKIMDGPSQVTNN